jgi:hypothetical protein
MCVLRRLPEKVGQNVVMRVDSQRWVLNRE